MGQYEGVYDLLGEVYDGVYETVQGYMGKQEGVYDLYLGGYDTSEGVYGTIKVCL